MAAVARLSDAEQYALQSWLQGGFRRLLTRLGVDWREIPASQFDGDDVESQDERVIVHSSALADLMKHYGRYRASIVGPIRQWFKWCSRTCLHEAGFTDADIGPRRIVPDDIFPDEYDFEEARDGSLLLLPVPSGLSTRAVLTVDGVTFSE